MDRFTSRMISYNEQQNIDRHSLRAIIMNGTSFRTVNNHFFIEFIKKLNPSYVLPGRKKLAREVLTEEMVYVENKNESLLVEAAHLTLNIDGWSDRCRRSLHEYNVITDSRRTIVLSLVDISSHHHTADFLVKKLEAILAQMSTTINITSKICAIVTDNPNKKQKMREIFISKPGNQHIIGSRWFAHAINLIAGDVSKHVYALNILNKITVVTTFANRSHMFKAKLKEEAQRIKIKKEALHTIATTKWSNVSDCLHSFILLRAPLEVLVAVHKSIASTKMIRFINNRSFFYDIENFAYYLHPKYRGSGMLTSGRSAVYCFLAEYSKKIGNNLTTTKNVTSALQRFEIKSGLYALNFTQGK
ncbi:unnamed protein product [Rotaria sp. Silwood1]|nr:unnamed protein product [Rotaria sp. Silwood1]